MEARRPVQAPVTRLDVTRLSDDVLPDLLRAGADEGYSGCGLQTDAPYGDISSLDALMRSVGESDLDVPSLFAGQHLDVAGERDLKKSATPDASIVQRSPEFGATARGRCCQINPTLGSTSWTSFSGLSPGRYCACRRRRLVAEDVVLAALGWPA